MAQRFIDEATATLTPVYAQQEQAIQAQIPAIQQLYQNLIQGLEGTRKTETQNILESASQRGVLRSTMPVDLQTQLANTILQQQGQYGAQQAQELAGVQSNLAQLGVQKASAIQQLADTLYNRDLAERDFQMKQQMTAAEAASGGGGGGSRKAPALPKLQQARGEVVSYLTSKAGRDGYVSPNVYKRVKNEFLSAGFTEKQWLETAKRFKNPKTKY